MFILSNPFPLTLIAKIILLKQGLWLLFWSFNCWRSCYCKDNSIKTRIVTFLFRWNLLDRLIAKIILLKQGLWLHLVMAISTVDLHCKDNSIKTRIVTFIPALTFLCKKDCKDNSIKTRIVTFFLHFGDFEAFLLQR